MAKPGQMGDIFPMRGNRQHPGGKPDPLSIIFVLDLPGIDEWSIPLLCSLKIHAPKDAALTAYVPDRKWPFLTPSVKALLKETGVETRLFPPDRGRRLFATRYPHGNKIVACLMAEEQARGRVLFLDTDVFLNAPLDADALFGDTPVAVCPAEYNSFSSRSKVWGPIYGLFGLDLPPRDRVAQRSGIGMFPYYNAGVIGFDAAAGFAGVWAETAAKIDHEAKGFDKRPWLDQIALPVALARMGMPVRELAPDWNFSLNGGEAGRDLEDTVRIAHWHWVRFLKYPRTHARCLEILREVLGDVTLHGIAARALQERAQILSGLPPGRETRGIRRQLERAQVLSERRRDQLEGF